MAWKPGDAFSSLMYGLSLALQRPEAALKPSPTIICLLGQLGVHGVQTWRHAVADFILLEIIAVLRRCLPLSFHNHLHAFLRTCFICHILEESLAQAARCWPTWDKSLCSSLYLDLQCLLLDTSFLDARGLTALWSHQVELGWLSERQGPFKGFPFARKSVVEDTTAVLFPDRFSTFKSFTITWLAQLSLEKPR